MGSCCRNLQILTPDTPAVSGTHGTTFGGSPLACAIGHHVLQRISDEAFVASVKENGHYLNERLAQMTKWFPKILQSDVRGRGLILGLGFHDGSLPSQMVSLARERGVLILTAGKDAVRLVPSLNIGREEVDFAADVLESCLAVVKNLK
jgi:acetylornithine aminotransferase